MQIFGWIYPADDLARSLTNPYATPISACIFGSKRLKKAENKKLLRLKITNVSYNKVRHE